MPIREYECKNCARVEEIIELGDTLEREMWCCGSTMDRLPAAPAIQFKGYGWTPKSYKGAKESTDTFEETENGQLRVKTGAGHDAP